MKRMSVLIAIFIAILTVAGRIFYVQSLPKISFTPNPTLPTLEPPKQAYRGTIRALKGDVKKIARTADDFAPIDRTDSILQGEVVATGNNASIKIAMEKMDDIIIKLKENTEVEFANLVYPSVVLRHRLGSATYATTTSSFSIRSLHALIELGTGAVSITTDDQTVTVQLEEGVVKLAMIDANNDTHVWKLTPGQKAVIDDEARTVTIKK